MGLQRACLASASSFFICSVFRSRGASHQPTKEFSDGFSKQLRLSRDTAQMAAAVPQVIAHRVGRMMTAGILPNRRDQQEFYMMGAEKVAAFNESWSAMSLQAVAAQRQFALWWVQTWWKVAMGGWMNPPSLQHFVEQRAAAAV